MLVRLTSGLWKPPSEAAQTLSFSEPQRAREIFPSIPASIFSASSHVEFNSKNEPSILSNQFYWSMRDSKTDSFSASTNKARVERKQEPTTVGCRLFGIEISSAVEEALPAATVSGVGYDQTALSVDVDSDQISQPSNGNKSDAPGTSSERSPLESQSRQVRSCTKVRVCHVISIFKMLKHTKNLITFPCAGNYARYGSWEGCGLDKTKWLW